MSLLFLEIVLTFDLEIIERIVVIIAKCDITVYFDAVGRRQSAAAMEVQNWSVSMDSNDS